MSFIERMKLVVLENGAVLSHGKFIGNTTDITLWIKLLNEANRWGSNSITELTDKVWGKVPMPQLFKAIYERDYNGKLQLKVLEEAQGEPNVSLSKDGYETKVVITTNNPFTLSEEERQEANTLLDNHYLENKAKSEVRAKIRSQKEQELLQLLKIKVKELPGAILKGEGDKLYKYSIEILMGDIVISIIKAEDFMQKIAPDIWKEYR